jgi:hypothetical protein
MRWSRIMTDPRIDLRVLFPDDPERANRVIQGAMARIEGVAPRHGVIPILAGWWRPAVAAAAVVVLTLSASAGRAAAAFEAARSRATPPPSEAVAEWVASSRVPTGTELVDVFAGYRP